MIPLPAHSFADMQRRLVLRLSLLAALAVSALVQAQSQSPQPAPVLPGQLRWVSPPPLPGMQFAWALGAESEASPYVLRVKLAKGAAIPPHTHPDVRITTVLEGTIYVGFGDAVDPKRAVAVPQGGIYVVPANVPHYLLAKEGDALYQENGVGPTGTAMLAH